MERIDGAKASGLDGIVVADTRLSEVEGERGRLILAGHDVEELAGTARFEDACGLLWDGALPDAAGREALRARIAAGRRAAFARLGELGGALAARDGMDALRAALAHLVGRPARTGAGLERDEAAALAGAVCTFAAAWARTRADEAPLAPDPSLALAADFLRMARGRAPAEAEVRALDAYLVTVSDHGMNASTFAARVVTSTGSDAVSALVAAISALKGPLHGGAPGPVLDMLDAVGTAERAEAWIEGELAAGRRIMGMGHRVYRARDPRAAVFERALERLEREAGAATASRAARLALARAVERTAERILAARHPERALRANVEFYTAVLLEALELPRELFTPTFAVGRTAGWCAHVDEQRRTGRLIRPSSRYVGAMPGA